MRLSDFEELGRQVLEPECFEVHLVGIFQAALVLQRLGGEALEARSYVGMERETAQAGEWLTVGRPEEIPDQCARIVAAPNGERIAVFRDGRQIGALTNVCAHQNGPIGEGRIINGCVTCPWHGYEYRLADGCAPAPFTEKLATYRLRIRDGIVEVDPNALPPGTPAAITLGE